MKSFTYRDHWVRLNESTQSELAWWRQFMEGWNEILLMPSRSLMSPPLVSDASGLWGCGTHWARGSRWFQWKWEGPDTEWDIAAKELLPIAFTLVVWGEKWAGNR